MKMDSQLRLAAWLLREGEAYKLVADGLPSARRHFGERMAAQGAAAACFELCKKVLAEDFPEQLEKRHDLHTSTEEV